LENKRFHSGRQPPVVVRKTRIIVVFNLMTLNFHRSSTSATDQRLKLTWFITNKEKSLELRTLVSSLLPPAHRPRPPTCAAAHPWRNASSPAPDSLRSTVPTCLPRSPAYSPTAQPPRRLANQRTRAKRRRRPRRRLSWWRRLPRAGGRTPRSERGMGRRRTTRMPASPGGAGRPTSRGSPKPSSPPCTSTSNTTGSLSHVRLLRFSCCSLLSLRLSSLSIVIVRYSLRIATIGNRN
jgi:hypothetical protein